MRWGFIGAGFVATEAMAPAVHAANGAVLAVVGARDPRRAADLGPERVSRDYLDVVEAEDVDAVYISLTNEAHERWAVRALNAGKHVLCEKPLALDPASVDRMLAAAEAASGLLVEALWYRWHPRALRTWELISDGVIGAPVDIDALFAFDGVPDSNYRLDAARGGGATLDVGPYVVDAAVRCLDAAGHRVECLAPLGRRAALERVTGGPGSAPVDLTTVVEFDVDDVRVRLAMSIDRPEEQRLRIIGTDATLEWQAPAFTPWKQPCGLTLERGGRREEITFDAVDAYRLMIEQTQRHFAGDEPSRMPAEGSRTLAHALAQVQEP